MDRLDFKNVVLFIIVLFKLVYGAKIYNYIEKQNKYIEKQYIIIEK